jgi:hypothetical protein
MLIAERCWEETIVSGQKLNNRNLEEQMSMKMKTDVPFVAAILFLLGLLLALPPQGLCMDDLGFVISRMVVCEEVVDREPVGTKVTFNASEEKVYCFLEATRVEQDKEVIFVWYHEKKEMARVPLLLRQGARWRTQSSIKINGLKGSWSVELQETSGVILHTVSFAVE